MARLSLSPAITTRHLEILFFVAYWECASRDHIAHRFFSGSKVYANRHLHALCDEGILQRLPTRWARPGQRIKSMRSRTPSVYAVAEKGAQYVNNANKAIAHIFHDAQAQAYRYSAPHALTTLDFLTMLRREAHGLGIQIAEDRTYGPAFLRGELTRKKAGLYPDAFVTLEIPGQTRSYSFWLEVDRSTETTCRFAEKLTRYAQWSTPSHRTQWIDYAQTTPMGMRFAPVLVITPSEQRKTNLLRATADLTAGGVHWFYSSRQAVAGRGIRAAGWQQAGRQDVSLFEALGIPRGLLPAQHSRASLECAP